MSATPTNSPLVSVITPAYGAARFIEATIASARAQTFQDWEMLVVDDASTDATPELVAEQARQDPRIRLYHNPRQAGASASRNLAIEAAAGRWLAFLDSDDLWLPDKLERQLAFAERSGGAFLYGGFRRISEDGTRIGRFVSVPPRIDYDGLLKNTCIATLTVMLDRERMPDVVFPDLRRCNDFALWLNLLRTCQWAHGLSEDLGRYRTVSNSLSSRRVRTSSWVWRVYRETAGLDVVRSAWCFSHYAARGALKRVLF